MTWHEAEHALTTNDGQPLDPAAAAAGVVYPFKQIGVLRRVVQGSERQRGMRCYPGLLPSQGGCWQWATHGAVRVGEGAGGRAQGACGEEGGQHAAWAGQEGRSLTLWGPQSPALAACAPGLPLSWLLQVEAVPGCGCFSRVEEAPPAPAAARAGRPNPEVKVSQPSGSAAV